MVIRPDVVYDAYNSIDKETLKNSKLIYLSIIGIIIFLPIVSVASISNVSDILLSNTSITFPKKTFFYIYLTF